MASDLKSTSNKNIYEFASLAVGNLFALAKQKGLAVLGFTVSLFVNPKKSKEITLIVDAKLEELGTAVARYPLSLRKDPITVSLITGMVLTANSRINQLPLARSFPRFIKVTTSLMSVCIFVDLVNKKSSFSTPPKAVAVLKSNNQAIGISNEELIRIHEELKETILQKDIDLERLTQVCDGMFAIGQAADIKMDIMVELTETVNQIEAEMETLNPEDNASREEIKARIRAAKSKTENLIEEYRNGDKRFISLLINFKNRFVIALSEI